MKLILKIVLLIYLTAVFNTIAYAQNSVPAAMGLFGLTSSSYAHERMQSPDLPQSMSFAGSLGEFAQDIPQISEYDWQGVKEKNQKLTAVLCNI